MKKFILPCLGSLILLNISFSQSLWGAIYIDVKTGIAGGSYNFASENQALQAAKQSCELKHQKMKIKYDCRPLGRFYNTCAAVYWSAGDNRSGWGTALNLNEAKLNARKGCTKDGGKNCQLSLTTCTDIIIY